MKSNWFTSDMIVADLHLHSRYAQAVSKFMSLTSVSIEAKRKGINLLAVGDFTHPVWLDEIKQQLVEVASGIYRLKSGDAGVRFMLGTEVCCMFEQKIKSRRVHLLVYAPNFDTVDLINTALNERGVDLTADGRPIHSMSVIELCQMLFGIDEQIVVIPAHIWTPWFGALGSKTGFNSLRECFGDYADKIYAVESGLSSNPAMNWRIEEFVSRQMVSFSDAHSVAKLGRGEQMGLF